MHTCCWTACSYSKARSLLHNQVCIMYTQYTHHLDTARGRSLKWNCIEHHAWTCDVGWLGRRIRLLLFSNKKDEHTHHQLPLTGYHANGWQDLRRCTPKFSGHDPDCLTNIIGRARVIQNRVTWHKRMHIGLPLKLVVAKLLDFCCLSQDYETAGWYHFQLFLDLP